MIYIIGSGLSAMAAATALVRRGVRPVILDAGLGPDPASVALKARLAAAEPPEWKAEDLARLMQTGSAALNGIPRKLYFGSDFTFRTAAGAAPLGTVSAAAFRSFAAGGFSNVWGAVIKEPAAGDLQDWPVAPEELAPHYSTVRTLLCSRNGTTPAQPRLSSQAEALYADLSAAREQLEGEGFRFSHAELAVRPASPEEHDGCRYCGLCLYGCPYNCRYSAAETLDLLIRSGQAEYRPGVVVNRLAAGNGSIRVEARSAAGNEPRVFQGDRVFVAAGPLESARIVLDSLRLYDTPVRLQHSDIFTLPLVRYRAAAGISNENLHTLCQLVAQIDDPGICAHPIHLQFYGYNDMYRRILSDKAGWMAPLMSPAVRSIAERLFVIFGYLHSSASSSMKLILKQEGGGGLRIEGVPNPAAAQAARAVTRKLLRERRLFNAIPIPFELRLDLPGGGYHSGGIFPMSRNPRDLETDRLGRLPQLPAVHLVDASVLPSVPASTIAFTVMANAHRIASECPVPDVD